MRLAYLTMANTFAVLRLLPMTDRDKDAEILVLRHQITVLERQLDGAKVRFAAADRALLAALLHRVPPEANAVNLGDRDAAMISMWRGRDSG